MYAWPAKLLMIFNNLGCQINKFHEHLLVVIEAIFKKCLQIHNIIQFKTEILDN